MGNFNEPVYLGKTGLKVGRLGISSSYGAPKEAFLDAYERGCNYFTWGTFIKGRSKAMAKAIREIIDRGERDKLITGIYSYSHLPMLMESNLDRGLKKLATEYTDILILGYFSKKPNQNILDVAFRLKKKGKVRFLALSSHNRKIFLQLKKEDLIDIYHIRYNAVHRGADNEIFPFLSGEAKPGIVAFTATRWGQLLNPKKMPAGEQSATAMDCYRFVLSHPSVDVCMSAAKTRKQMQENLKTLDTNPMTEEELGRMRRIGNYLHKR